MIYYGYYLCPIRSTNSPLYSPRGILNSSHIAPQLVLSLAISRSRCSSCKWHNLASFRADGSTSRHVSDMATWTFVHRTPGLLSTSGNGQVLIWVCLKIGYTPNYSHLVGIMISKTIGFRGLAYFQTNPYRNTTCGVTCHKLQYPNQCSVKPAKALPLNKTVVELMHGSETVFPVSQRHLESQQQSMDWIALTEKKSPETLMPPINSWAFPLDFSFQKSRSQHVLPRPWSHFLPKCSATLPTISGPRILGLKILLLHCFQSELLYITIITIGLKNRI